MAWSGLGRDRALRLAAPAEPSGASRIGVSEKDRRDREANKVPETNLIGEDVPERVEQLLLLWLTGLEDIATGNEATHDLEQQLRTATVFLKAADGLVALKQKLQSMRQDGTTPDEEDHDWRGELARKLEKMLGEVDSRPAHRRPDGGGGETAQ